MSSIARAEQVRRMCISLDIEEYSRWRIEDQKIAQDSLAAILQAVCEEGRLDRGDWSVQPAGDGELAVLPPNTDEGRTIRDFAAGLTAHLYQHNRRLNDANILRLRVAMHVGLTQAAGMGFAGPAPVTVTRLRDGMAVKDLMARHPGKHFALVLCPTLYQDHVAGTDGGLPAASFQPVRVDMPEKRFVSDAWVFLGGTGREPEHAPSPQVQGPVTQVGNPASSAGGVRVNGGIVVANEIVGGDLYVNSPWPNHLRDRR